MTLRTLAFGGLLTASIGCAPSSRTAADLPLISPPVRSATPVGLQVTARTVDHAFEAMLEAWDLRERFFSGSGPTDLMTILASIDQRLDEVNDAGPRACLDQAPVSYTITPAGGGVELFAQCYRRFSGATTGDPAFMQFGQRDGKTALYVAGGAARLAALVTPIEGTTDHVVDAWYGVGYTNAAGCGSTGTFDGCSYAITELHANPATKAFEMSVAGLGVGFCGVQFASDGALLHGVGSTDMGIQCNPAATLCASAGDLTASDQCRSSSYELPALGRLAGAGAHQFGASGYPDVPNITLNGTTSDSLYFAPLAPTAGVGDFDAK